jgi:hypothetical protein
MAGIFLYKMKTENMKEDKFVEIGRQFEIKGKPVATEESLAIHDSKHALAYAQPGGKFAGLLFYVDQSHGQAEPVEKVIDSKNAERWAVDFLNKFGLAPKKLDNDKIRLVFEIITYEDQAVSFDGKERRKLNLKTEIGSKIEINGVPVLGPRATVRMVFKDRAEPVSIHRGLWESIEVYEERELVREHDVFTAVKENLSRRQDCKVYYDVVDCRMAYFAREFFGGPDILAPFYFLEVEYEAADADKRDRTQGPRQILMFPAYR